MAEARGSRGRASVQESIDDLRDLRAFCLVVDVRSFTAAARLTHESKPTVSRRVARLERALGVQLLHRSARRIAPTDEGALYRAQLAHVLESLEEANTVARGAKTMPGGPLRITAPPELSTLLAPLLIGFADRYPAVSLETMITQKVLDLDAERIDAAFRVSFQLADSSLVAHRLLGLELAFVGSPTYFRGRPRPRSIDQLDRHRLLMLPARPNIGFGPEARSRSEKLASMKPFITSSELSFLRELALASGGIALVPTVCIDADLASGALVRVLAAEHRMPAVSLFLVHHAARVLTPKVRAFRDFMLEAFGTPGRTLAP